jgi:hypothetical protein
MANDEAFRKPLKYLDKAAERLDRGETEKALGSLLKAAFVLAESAHPAAPQLRHWVASAIAEAARATLPPARPWLLDQALLLMAGDSAFDGSRRSLADAADALATGDLAGARRCLAESIGRLTTVDHPWAPVLGEWLAATAADLEE